MGLPTTQGVHMIEGPDVASYQSPNFDTSGAAFVWIKATEGTTYTNPHMAGQLATARKAELVVGFYHFLHPGRVADQVAYFLKQAPEGAGDMLAVDWEKPPAGAAATEAEKNQALHLLKGTKLFHKVGLYCNRDYWLTRDQSGTCGDFLWIADPGAPKGHPKVTHPWAFHQYGNPGGMDRNVANFASKAALLAWAKGAPNPAPAGPTLDQRVSTLEKEVKALEAR